MDAAARYDQLWQGDRGVLQRYGPTSRHQRRVTARLLDGLGSRSVLDVGCGEGSNLALLHARHSPARAVVTCERLAALMVPRRAFAYVNVRGEDAP